MIVEVNNFALSKKFQKLINKLAKTSIKYSGFKIKKSQITISFVDKKEIKRLNSQFRNVDKETDVLSFPTLNLIPGKRYKIKEFKEDINPQTKHLMLGDIIICEEVAKNNAKEYGHSFEREICYLIVHGILHVLGYDHEDEQDKMIMRCYEEAILRRYGITR